MAGKEYLIQYSVSEKGSDAAPLTATQELELSEAESAMTSLDDIFKEVEESILEGVFGESS